MTFRAQKPSVTLKVGRSVPLNGPLIAGTRRPAQGWHATFRINGVDLTFNGKTPQEVASKVQKAHYTQGVVLSSADVWLNLNLQWMERLDLAYFTVDKGTLTANILTEGEKKVETLRKAFTPEQWGSRAWNYIGLYLAQDNYDPSGFLMLMEQILGILNPNTNPTTGCLVCYTETSNALQAIRLQPPATQEDARKWVWTFHNSVNVRIRKPQVTWDLAKKLNFWS